MSDNAKIRFEDLGPVIQDLLKALKDDVTSDDMTLLNTVSVADMAKVYNMRAAGQSSETIVNWLLEKAKVKKRNMEKIDGGGRMAQEAEVRTEDPREDNEESKQEEQEPSGGHDDDADEIACVVGERKRVFDQEEVARHKIQRWEQAEYDEWWCEYSDFEDRLYEAAHAPQICQAEEDQSRCITGHAQRHEWGDIVATWNEVVGSLDFLRKLVTECGGKLATSDHWLAIATKADALQRDDDLVDRTFAEWEVSLDKDSDTTSDSSTSSSDSDGSSDTESDDDEDEDGFTSWSVFFELFVKLGFTRAQAKAAADTATHANVSHERKLQLLAWLQHRSSHTTTAGGDGVTPQSFDLTGKQVTEWELDQAEIEEEHEATWKASVDARVTIGDYRAFFLHHKLTISLERITHFMCMSVGERKKAFRRLEEQFGPRPDVFSSLVHSATCSTRAWQLHLLKIFFVWHEIEDTAEVVLERSDGNLAAMWCRLFRKAEEEARAKGHRVSRSSPRAKTTTTISMQRVLTVLTEGRESSLQILAEFHFLRLQKFYADYGVSKSESELRRMLATYQGKEDRLSYMWEMLLANYGPERCVEEGFLLRFGLALGVRSSSSGEAHTLLDVRGGDVRRTHVAATHEFTEAAREVIVACERIIQEGSKSQRSQRSAAFILLSRYAKVMTTCTQSQQHLDFELVERQSTSAAVFVARALDHTENLAVNQDNTDQWLLLAEMLLLGGGTPDADTFSECGAHVVKASMDPTTHKTFTVRQCLLNSVRCSVRGRLNWKAMHLLSQDVGLVDKSESVTVFSTTGKNCVMTSIQILEYILCSAPSAWSDRADLWKELGDKLADSDDGGRNGLGQDTKSTTYHCYFRAASLDDSYCVNLASVVEENETVVLNGNKLSYLELLLLAASRDTTSSWEIWSQLWVYLSSHGGDTTSDSSKSSDGDSSTSSDSDSSVSSDSDDSDTQPTTSKNLPVITLPGSRKTIVVTPEYCERRGHTKLFATRWFTPDAKLAGSHYTQRVELNTEVRQVVNESLFGTEADIWETALQPVGKKLHAMARQQHQDRRKIISVNANGRVHMADASVDGCKALQRTLIKLNKMNAAHLQARQAMVHASHDALHTWKQHENSGWSGVLEYYRGVAKVYNAKIEVQFRPFFEKLMDEEERARHREDENEKVPFENILAEAKASKKEVMIFEVKEGRQQRFDSERRAFRVVYKTMSIKPESGTVLPKLVVENPDKWSLTYDVTKRRVMYKDSESRLNYDASELGLSSGNKPAAVVEEKQKTEVVGGKTAGKTAHVDPSVRCAGSGAKKRVATVAYLRTWSDEYECHYYQNLRTNETTWDDPTEEGCSIYSEVQQGEDASYYVNDRTESTRWDLPKDDEEEEKRAGELQVSLSRQVSSIEERPASPRVRAPPDVFVELSTEDGDAYFMNFKTGQTMWERPVSQTDRVYKKVSEGDDAYYWNEKTGSTVWDLQDKVK